MPTRLIALMLLLLAAQSEQTATIRGVVLDAITGKPIIGAAVQVTQVQQGQGQSQTFKSTTGTDGAFVLENLIPIPSFLSVEKGGYLKETRRYVLSAGLNAKDSVIRLSTVGIVSGRVLNSRGEPAVLARVTLLFRRIGPDGAVELANGPNMETNDRGEFRFVDLLPGKYFVSFLSDSRWPSDAPHNFPSLQPPAREPRPLSLMLYPNAANLSQATSIEVKGSEEVRLTDVVLAETRSGPVRIKLLNPPDEPAKDIGLRYKKPPVVQRDSFAQAYAIDADLRPNLPLAQLGVGPALHMASGSELEREFWPEQFGIHEIEVSWKSDNGGGRFVTSLMFDGSSTDVAVVLAKPDGRLDFRVTTISKEGLPVAAPRVSLRWSRSGLTFLPESMPQEEVFGPNIATASMTTEIGASGRSDVVGLSSGRYDLLSVSVPADSYLASVRQGDRNVLIEGMVASNKSDPVEFVIRSGAGMLRGKVTSSSGSPVHNAVVALLPDSPLNESRLTSLRRIVRTDQDGAFEIRGIAPNSYHVYAWSPAEYPWTERQSYVYLDKEFVKKYEDRARVAEVRESGQHVLDVVIPE